jgi:hypothetical protein
MSLVIDLSAAPSSVSDFVVWLEVVGAKILDVRQASVLNLKARFVGTNGLLVAICADRGLWFVEVGFEGGLDADCFDADVWSTFLDGRLAYKEPRFADADVDEQIAYFVDAWPAIVAIKDRMSALVALGTLRHERAEKRLGFPIPRSDSRS